MTLKIFEIELVSGLTKFVLGERYEVDDARELDVFDEDDYLIATFAAGRWESIVQEAADEEPAAPATENAVESEVVVTDDAPNYSRGVVPLSVSQDNVDMFFRALLGLSPNAQQFWRL